MKIRKKNKIKKKKIKKLKFLMIQYMMNKNIQFLFKIQN